MKQLLFESNDFNFMYNEFEKPSSKSYMSPCIKEVHVISYKRFQLDDNKTEYEVLLDTTEHLSEIAQEQLKLFLINLDEISDYSKVNLNLLYL